MDPPDSAQLKIRPFAWERRARTKNSFAAAAASAAGFPYTRMLRLMFLFLIGYVPAPSLLPDEIIRSFRPPGPRFIGVKRDVWLIFPGL